MMERPQDTGGIRRVSLETGELSVFEKEFYCKPHD